MAKSELILAFNEIAETRKLSKEVIIEALKMALVSAYRRNMGISSAQFVEARVDDKSGIPTIWVEKEVVEDIQTDQTEVLLSEARELYPDIQLGDMAIVEDTPEDFGRIAAQTAKQVILQRMREAERDAQYEEYQDRVGDLVTGTVQSHSGDVITIGLGRTEAILPRSQQMPGERYRMHGKVRAYVMEVRRTSRGPQIVVSRTHRKMLRRLLEYEVPEIYNGTVEIKSIAREPGARSKVAVAALQPGADPVGACVGMRGVRIQSIVNELNGEKIDVIEWSEDSGVFISKALSPARVSSVFLDDDPQRGRTATVVVPDDQLSLAIGREGQNARLAAKLTGWRIDIKSVSETAEGAHQLLLGDPDAASFVTANSELFEQITVILEKKAESRPIMPEDYQLLTEFVKLSEGYRHEVREEGHAELREKIGEAKSQVPAGAYAHPLDDTDLPLRVYNLLVEAGYSTVGEVMEQYYLDDGSLLSISGFGPSALEEVQKMTETMTFEDVVEEEEIDDAVAETEPVAADEEVSDEADGIEAAPDEIPEEEWDEEDEVAKARRAELVARMGIAVEDEDTEIDAAPAASEPVEASAEVISEDEDELAEEEEFEDFTADELFEFDDMTEEERQEIQRRKDKQRRRQLVFDEDAGRVVARRRRKSSRSQDDWIDKWDEDDT